MDGSPARGRGGKRAKRGSSSGGGGKRSGKSGTHASGFVDLDPNAYRSAENSPFSSPLTTTTFSVPQAISSPAPSFNASDDLSFGGMQFTISDSSNLNSLPVAENEEDLSISFSGMNIALTDDISTGDMGVSFSGMQLSDSTGDDHESSSTLDFLARFRLTQPADDEEEEEEGIEVNNPLDFSSMQLFRMSGDGLGMEDVSNTSLESGGGVEEKATTPASSSNFAFISSVTSSAEYGVDSNLVSSSSDSGLQEEQHRTVVDSLKSFREKDRHVSETKEVVEPDKSYSLPHRERSSSVRDTFNIEERIRRCQIEFRSNLEKERSRGSSARNEYRALYLEKADYLRKLEELHEKENQIQSEQEAAGLAEDFERAEVLGHKLDSIREELTQLDDSLTTLSKRIRDPQSVIQKLPRCEIELRNRYIRTLSDLRDDAEEWMNKQDYSVCEEDEKDAERCASLVREADRTLRQIEVDAQIVEQRRADIDRRVLDKSKSVREDIAIVSKTIATFECEIADLELKLARLRENLARERKVYESLNSQIASNAEEFSEEIARSDEEIQSIVRRKEIALADRERADGLHKAAVDRLEEGHRRLEADKQALSELSDSISENASMVAELERHGQMVRSNLTLLQEISERRASHRREIMRYREHIRHAEEELERTASEQIHLRERAAAVRNNIATAERRVPELESEKKLASSARNYKLAASLNKQSKDLEAEIREMQTELLELETRSSHLDERSQECRVALDKAIESMQTREIELERESLPLLVKEVEIFETMIQEAHQDEDLDQEKSLSELLSSLRERLRDLRARHADTLKEYDSKLVIADTKEVVDLQKSMSSSENISSSLEVEPQSPILDAIRIADNKPPLLQDEDSGSSTLDPEATSERISFLMSKARSVEEKMDEAASVEDFDTAAYLQDELDSLVLELEQFGIHDYHSDVCYKEDENHAESESSSSAFDSLVIVGKHISIEELAHCEARFESQEISEETQERTVAIDLASVDEAISSSSPSFDMEES